ncbi:alpha/beta hydrolase, partial [Brachyspira hampsonii]
MQYILYIILSIIILLLILIIISNHFVNKLLIKTNKKLFERKESGKEESEEKKRIKEERRIWFKSYQKDVYTVSDDNLKLHAHFINNNSNVYVIIVHPYEGRGSYMKYFIEKFYNMGFNILAIDLRTHGESEGKLYSLGYLERLDVLAWIKYIN